MARFPRLRQTVLDCTDPRTLAEFYRELLGFVYRPGDEPAQGGGPEPDWLVLRDPRGTASLAFQQVASLAPATWPDGPVPQQLHLDLEVADLAELRAQHERVLALGARLLRDRFDDPEEPLGVYADPAGHPFCVFVAVPRTGLRALVLNCSLKRSSEPSNTQALADVVAGALEKEGVTVRSIRLADLNVPPGVETDLGEGDEWPSVHAELLRSQILIVASPTWVGRPSSLAQRALERMDAMLSETDDEGRPVAYDRVAGVVVTGNEDGAHHVISEIAGGLADIGYTIPGQAWTYWHLGPGPGPDYLDSDQGRDWSARTARAMAANLAGVARALSENPLSAPPG